MICPECNVNEWYRNTDDACRECSALCGCGLPNHVCRTGKRAMDDDALVAIRTVMSAIKDSTPSDRLDTFVSFVRFHYSQHVDTLAKYMVLM